MQAGEETTRAGKDIIIAGMEFLMPLQHLTTSEIHIHCQNEIKLKVFIQGRIYLK